jgi:hypothetical protein
MEMRATGVEMGTAYPVNLGSKVAPDLRHEPARIGFEVRQLPTIFGIHDQAEMVPVSAAPINEGAAVSGVTGPIEELLSLAVLTGAIALNVADMG